MAHPLRDGRVVAAAAVALAVGALMAHRAGGGGAASARVARTPASPVAPPSPVIEVRVPRAAITLDGELREREWTGPRGRTGAFLDQTGVPARPFSQGHFAWGDGNLYVALYAADEDVSSVPAGVDAPLWLADSFQISFGSRSGPRVIDVGPTGAVTDARRTPVGLDYRWSSGAKTAADVDGTLDDPRDDDEEWVIEMAIPLASLDLDGRSGERITLALRRCDRPRGSPRTCATFGARGAELEPGGAELVLD